MAAVGDQYPRFFRKADALVEQRSGFDSEIPPIALLPIPEKPHHHRCRQELTAGKRHAEHAGVEQRHAHFLFAELLSGGAKDLEIGEDEQPGGEQRQWGQQEGSHCSSGQ